MQVFFFFTSAILFFLNGHLYKTEYLGRLGFYLFAITCVFLIGEELSWGQRFFDNSIIDFLRTHNAQNETNLHNLYPFQRYRHWLLIFFGLAGLVSLRIGKRFNTKEYLGRIIDIFQPDKNLHLLFVMVLIIGIGPEIGYFLRSVSENPDAVMHIHMKLARSTEVGELYVSLATVLYAYYKFKRVSNGWR